MANDGMIISTSEPTTVVGNFTWVKINQDGSKDYYEKDNDDVWQLIRTEHYAEHDHTHTEFGDIAFTGSITIDDLTAKTVSIPYQKPGGSGTGTLHFHDGLLVNNT